MQWCSLKPLGRLCFPPPQLSCCWNALSSTIRAHGVKCSPLHITSFKIQKHRWGTLSNKDRIRKVALRGDAQGDEGLWRLISRCFSVSRWLSLRGKLDSAWGSGNSRTPLETRCLNSGYISSLGKGLTLSGETSHHAEKITEAAREAEFREMKILSVPALGSASVVEVPRGAASVCPEDAKLFQKKNFFPFHGYLLFI